MKIEILVFDGFDELDAVGPWEVLHSAAGRGAPFEVSMTSLRAPGTVVAAYGLRVEVRDRPGAPALLLVPGGGWARRAANGVNAELERGEVPRLIAERHAAGAVVASVCTGALLLAAAGLLHGRAAATHPSARAALAAAGAEPIDPRVVDAGDVITAGGVTAGIDLGLWLVERFAGAALADRVAAGLDHPGRGPVWREGEWIAGRAHRAGEAG
jgi:transcriptional regulator GlxA family with amidase domain